VKVKLDKLFLHPFKCPTLLINGAQDYAFLNHNLKFCKINPETSIYVLPNCGHLTNIEKYGEFNKVALSFINKCNLKYEG